MKIEQTRMPSRHLPEVYHLSIKDVAAHLGVSPRTIQRMVREGRFPQPIEPSPNRRVWPLTVFAGWQDAQLQANVRAAPNKLARPTPEERDGLIRKKIADLLGTLFDRAVSIDEIVIRASEVQANGRPQFCIDVSNPQEVRVIQDFWNSLPLFPAPSGISQVRPETGMSLYQSFKLPVPSGHVHTILRQPDPRSVSGR